MEIEEAVYKARSFGADEAEVLCVKNSSLSVGVRLGDIEKITHSETIDYGLRVIINKKQAVVSANHLDLKLIEKALEIAKLSPADPLCGLASDSEICKSICNIELEDKTPLSLDDLKNQALEAEEAALSLVSNSDGSEVQWLKTEKNLITSNGFSGSFIKTLNALSVTAVAKKNNFMERDYSASYSVFKNDLKNPKLIGIEAGQRALSKIGSRKIPSVKAPVLFAPRTARTILSDFLNAINGELIAKKGSFLQNKLNKQIMSSDIKIEDNPLINKGLRSFPFDFEGLCGKQRFLVNNGILENFILDLKSARTLNLLSTAHAKRTVSSVPSPDASNVFLNAGKESKESLIKSIKKGLLVTELIGMGVNLLTGDYSRGACGFWIENGEICYPVSEIAITSNLSDMFLKMIPANDLIIERGIDSPSILIDSMSISGF